MRGRDCPGLSQGTQGHSRVLLRGRQEGQSQGRHDTEAEVEMGEGEPGQGILATSSNWKGKETDSPLGPPEGAEPTDSL